MVAFDPLISPLFVPATRPERIAKAAASGADAIIVDLEDAVPVSAKREARIGLAGQLHTLAVPVFVRVNAVGTPWFADDIAFVRDVNIQGIVLPKTERAADINSLPADTPVIGLVETALGIISLPEICETTNLRQLAFGSIDYALDLDCEECRDALLLARLSLLTQSRAHDLPAPLDGVTVSVNDESVIEDDSNYAKRLGFGGKLAIHPRQVSIINTTFAVGPQEIEWAHQIKAAEHSGKGAAVQLDGKMIDAPVIAKANRILARARKA